MRDEKCTARDFANSLYAIAALHACGAQGCQTIAQNILEELTAFLITHESTPRHGASPSAADEYRLTGRNKRQIFQSCQAFGFDVPEGVLEHDGTIKYETVKNKDNPSKGEQVLKTILRNDGYQPDPPSEHPATLTRVDLSCTMKPTVVKAGTLNPVEGAEQRKVLLQYDGPSHYLFDLQGKFARDTQNNLIENGATRLNSFLIRQYEASPAGSNALLVRIPFTLFEPYIQQIDKNWDIPHELTNAVFKSIGQAALAEQQAREAGTGAPSPQCAPDGLPKRLTGPSPARAADDASASPQSPLNHSAHHNQRSAGGGRSSH